MTLLGITVLTIGAAFYQWYATGIADLFLFLRLALVLLGLLVLYQAVTYRVAHVAPDRCARCGAKTFETRRSLDRTLVETCFACGSESLAPTPPSRKPAGV